MSAAITVHGETEAANSLDRMARRTIDQRVPMAGAGRSAARSIRGIPVATGRLEASVRMGVRATSHGYAITSDVPYARFVFHGTRKMRARPPQVPASVAPASARAALGWITR